MKIISAFKKEGVLPVTVAVVTATFLIVTMVQATTTIGTDITTQGALSVTGATTLTGDATIGHASTTQLSNSGASWFTGDTTLGHASTTQLSNSGASWFTGDTTLGHASTTMLSNIQTANSATTTAYLGCVQTYATTTSQPIKLVFYASSTVANAVTSASMTAGAGGYVLFAFGYCP